MKTRIVLLVVLTLLLTGCPSPTPPPSTARWLGNDVNALIGSAWMRTYGYGDCGLDGCTIWPNSMIDCAIPEGLVGPSAGDRGVVADPPGLFYRHLTPKQFLESGQSLLVGVEGSLCGRTLQSVSLMVHGSEQGHVDKIGVTARVAEFFQPFVEGATGQKIQTRDLEPLYRAALYNCGANNGGSTAGRGVNRVFGDYVAVVQWWDGLQDCNIHVVKIGSRE
jgi:hypothetical protein